MIHIRLAIACLLLSCSLGLNPNEKHEDQFNQIPSTRKFRSAKVKKVWDKANTGFLSSVVLSELYVELKGQDKEWMDLKHLKHDGGDKDGMIEADLQKRFNALLVKYNLVEKENNDAADNYAEDFHTKPIFQDTQLNKLWLTTLKSNKFSHSELEKLYTEFKHHEDKLFEYKNLKTSVSELNDISENSVERISKAEELKRQSEMLNDLKVEVKENFERISLMSKKFKDADKSSVPFVEPRVMDLWKLASEGNFTDEELLSIKDELQHFENRIEKHRHFKYIRVPCRHINQSPKNFLSSYKVAWCFFSENGALYFARDELKNSAQKLDYHGGKHKAPMEKVKVHQRLLDKVQDLGYKVQKLFNGLRDRLTKGIVTHNEL